MKITNITTKQTNEQNTIYTVSIVIDGIICVQNIKIKIYSDDMVVEWPDIASPINDEIRDTMDNYILSHIITKQPLSEKIVNWLTKRTINP